MKKRIINALAFTVALTISASPLSAVSAPDISDESLCTEFYQEEVNIKINTEPSDELLYNYMLQQSGVRPEPDSMKSGRTVCFEPGITAGSKLTGADENVYGYLKTEIQKIASGERTSTVIDIPFSVLGVKEGPWSASELGVSYIYSNGYSQEAVDAACVKMQYDYRKVVDSLLADCPYDLYWCDKSSYRPSYTMSYYARRENGEYMLYLTLNHRLTLYVSTDYSENGAEKTTTLPDGRLSLVGTAISNAQSIVNEYSQYRSGKELLDGYREAICSLTTYDDNAVAYNAAYGDPWQLINVFDGDTSTNVVCEGYAKAFKYLCDLSADKLPNISCLTASGTTTGPHMWNVVNMDDNRSYLVDITACDSMDDYSVTPQVYIDTFFLSIPSGGTYNSTYRFSRPQITWDMDGYTYTMEAAEYNYTYDEATLDIYDNKYLRLSTIPYVAYTYISGVPATCDTDGNIPYYTDPDGRYYILEGDDYTEIAANDVIVPKTGHDWNTPGYTWNDDNTQITARRVCKNDASHVETETVNASISITKEATCTEDGITTYSAQFSNPDFSNQEKSLENISALGHSFGTPVYEWAVDGSSCSAAVNCTRAGCSEKIEETASISSNVKTPATYTSMGWTQYTAHFADPHFTAQIKDVQDIPMLVGTEVMIELIDINGIKKRTTVYAESFSGYDLPSTYLDGYSFKGWTVNGTLYTDESAAQTALASIISAKPAEPVVICVKYEKKAGSYSVSVTGGSMSNGKTSADIQVSSLITVKADTLSGKKFSHWLRNGVKVSTNETYSFYMPSGNVSLTAVFSEGEVQKVGTAIIESVKAYNGKLSFVSVLNVPKNCTMVKGGLVATNNSSAAENLTAENADYVKISVKSTANTKNLKYTWTKGNVTTPWFVRGYLVYKDSSGVEHTVYSTCVMANADGSVSELL